MLDSTARNDEYAVCWFAMRDLKRPNAKTKAYEELTELGYEVFTPMRWEVKTVAGKRVRRCLPVISDLLFVRSDRHKLDKEVTRSATLQYRYAKGARACPITVPEADMDRFVKAVNAASQARYYLPEEIRPEMYGREVRVIGGPLDGYHGHLLAIKGQRKKRLLLNLHGLLTAAIEVTPDYLQLL